MLKKEDIISPDGFLDFCNRHDICYIQTGYFYTNSQYIWRGKIHSPKINKICVIGHSDYSVVDEISSKFEKVFCVNRYTTSQNTFGLPLGITCDCDDSSIHRIYGNKDIMIEISNDEINKINLAYINFDISTYPIEREFVFKKFSSQSWVKLGNMEKTIDGRKKFLREIKSSKFVFCPRGNGIDTHRLWETLYMGSIPIVKYELTHHLFTDLPILFINDWNEITEDYLNKKYDEYTNKTWNLDKLKMSYWETFIKNNL